VAEFGGQRQFTPPFVISQQCDRNCSFPSGEAAAAFFSLTLARALSRRKVYFAAAVCAGAVVSLTRVAVGAHFFSDAVTSFFVMWILTDVLHHYLVLTPAERKAGRAAPAWPGPARPAEVPQRLPP
jgi:lipid A 4'-phosphatase